jgi:tetratricopeptide (TPR) repeat protein
VSRLRVVTLFLLAVSFLAASPGAQDPAALLEEADAAFARGDYGLAEELYARAEPRAADPGRVTLGLAAAKYRRALALPTRSVALLAEAEELYRSCLDSSDPRHVRALVGLGNCLMREAGSRDARSARAAAESYGKAEVAAENADLSEASRYNLQRARLLARQIPGTPPDREEKPPPNDKPESDHQPPEADSQPREPGQGNDRKKGSVRTSATEDGQSPLETEESRSPGKGEIPPIPDSDRAPPLTPAEAREHLTEASQRILEKSRLHRRGGGRTDSSGVRDW